METLNLQSLDLPTCYDGRCLFASLWENGIEIDLIVGQQEHDIRWYDDEFVAHIHENIEEVYYFEQKSNLLEEWTGLLKFKNGYYMFFDVGTTPSGFSSYDMNQSEMYLSKDLDYLMTYGLGESDRNNVQKQQTKLYAERMLSLYR